MSKGICVAIITPSYNVKPTPHCARINDALAQLSTVAPEIDLIIVSISGLGGDTRAAKLKKLVQRIRKAVDQADVVHLVSFLPFHPLLFRLIRHKPVLLGPNITGAAFPKKFMGKPALKALKAEMPGYWCKWLLGGGALREHTNIWLSRHVKRIISLSAYAADIIASRGLSRPRIEIMPFAAPLMSETSEAKRMLGNIQKPLIAYVGRLDRRKGFDLFLEMTSLIKKNVCFVVIGEGRMRADLEAAMMKEPRIIWLGRKHRAELLALFPLVDVYVQPSTYEAIATTVLEALRAGVPVLSADIPSHHEIAEQIGGVRLFPSGDAKAAAAKLDDMIAREQDLRVETAVAATRLQTSNTARWLADIYHELAEGV